MRVPVLALVLGLVVGWGPRVATPSRALGAGAKVAGMSPDAAGMLRVPAGDFWMGSDDGDDDEKPRRRVFVSAFQIDRHEVTNTLYRRFVGATRRSAPAYRNNARLSQPGQPVVGVNWPDADAYCQWAGKRLPSEAEWEKAARGVDGRKFPWGDSWDPNRASSGQRGAESPAVVGSYPGGGSPYGVEDMAGNVWEWVADWLDAAYYLRAPQRDPRGPTSGVFRVLRGGSWTSNPLTLRAANRYGLTPEFQGINVGFRCAKGP